METKKGGITLLEEGRGFLAEGKPSWTATSEGLLGRFNPFGWATLHAALWKLVDGAKKWLYDQFVMVENAGAVVVILDDFGRVALIQNYRMVGERIIPGAGSDYVRRLNAEKRWTELFESLGQDTWECPKGLASVEGEEKLKDDLEGFIKKVAAKEALEEAGISLANVRVLRARLNWNPTFCVHSQYVVVAKVASVGEAQPEDLEIIGGLRFCTPAQVREMVDRGQIIDAMTIGAMAIAGFNF